MKKFLKKFLLIEVILFSAIWVLSLLKCEFLTYCYGEQFEEIYKENTMMGEIDYLKVLNYSQTQARVYYVSENRLGGDVLVFTKVEGVWKYDRWEETVWSKHGSADGYIWPYVR